jgi:hypothetical protein
MADIVIINPKFEMSFWGLEAGSRCYQQIMAAQELCPITSLQIGLLRVL